MPLVVIPNQVFIGCPWNTVRPKYERALGKLKVSSPLSFVIVGRAESQDAADLLDVIKERLTSSSYAIFDATGGNANVSLEYGFAEGNEIPRALYLSTHKSAQSVAKDSPIIADLAGKKQNRYKQEPALLRLLRQASTDHAYTKRFEKFITSTYSSTTKGKKRRGRTLALKVIHQLDGKREVRRADVVQALLADQVRYSREEADRMILRLHVAGLIRSLQGPHSKLSVR
jgi:hypothetical protein